MKRLLIFLLPAFLFAQTTGFVSLRTSEPADITKNVAQFHRIDSINVTTADTWVAVKWDTLIASESNSGFSFSSDSTQFIMSCAGVIRIQGCMHWIWYGAANQNVKIFARVLINSNEARCLQANDTRGRQTSNTGMLPFTGTISCSIGDTVTIQYRVSNTSMDFESDPAFDNGVAMSVNFEKLSR